MTRFSRFGLKKLEELAKISISNERIKPDEDIPSEIPVADRGEGLERNDQFVSGDFRSRFEHISRYSRVCENQWETIADIGCGTGYGTFILSGKGHAVGVEFSEEAVKYAKRRYSSCEFVRGDAGALPLKSEGFDAATAFEVIEHLRDPEVLLDECHRILRKGGTLLLSSPNPAHIGNLLRKAFFRTPIPAKVDPNNQYHIREFSYDELISTISTHGYELEWTMGQTLPIDQFVPGSGYIVRRPLEVLGLSDVYDWLMSMMGRKFPRLSWTVVYAARRR
jgi:ubiquinone/menaquinone biosynthesis C-methylase UbiE